MFGLSNPSPMTDGGGEGVRVRLGQARPAAHARHPRLPTGAREPPEGQARERRGTPRRTAAAQVRPPHMHTRVYKSL